MSEPFDIIVPAAGIGSRMVARNAAVDATLPQLPKQYLPLLGTPILERTLQRLLELKPRTLCLVVAKEDEHWRALPSAAMCKIAIGGATRADSVRAGLDTLLETSVEDLVLVHDAVRPLFSLADVRRLMTIASQSEAGGLLATPVIDTLKISRDSESVDETPDRAVYWQAQTPQAFTKGLLQRALATVSSAVTDEASAIEALGLRPKLVNASRDNIKITTIEDLALAEFLLQKSPSPCA